ncbi:MAG TPA: hypothetical protein VL381_02795 [Rhodocyclaceae bacterium]|nr:hypothetical protein [Rhodocyclaceae bacterium]
MIQAAEIESQPLPSHWKIAGDPRLVWRDWGEEEIVVFSQQHGHTFLLSASSWLVLSVLMKAGQALSLAELTHQILDSCVAETSNDDVMTLLDSTLPEFYRIGLAEPLVSDN